MDWNRFIGACDRYLAQRAASALGGLAPFWLSDAAMNLVVDSRGEKARAARTPLPAEPGCCWPICVNADHRTHGLLRDAMPLPLKWTKDAGHAPRLPPALADLADEVVDDLSDGFPEIAGHCWGLGFAVNNAPELSGLRDIVVDSAWVSLAAGLVVLATDGSPDRTVWSTGAWSGDERKWVGGVGGIERKVAAAIAFGARTIYVPDSNQHEAVAAAARLSSDVGGSPIEVFNLPKDQPKPALALGPYLARLLADLPEGASHKDLATRYGLLHAFDRNRAKEWNRRRVAPKLAPFLQNLRPERVGRFTHLVTIASGSPELVALAVETLRPARVLLLHTEATRGKDGTVTTPNKHVVNVRNQLMTLTHKPDVVERAYALNSSLRAALRRHVSEFLDGVPPEDVLFDLTPGQFPTKLALMESVIDPRSSQMFFVHDQDPNGDYVIPFSQRMIFWKPGESWRFPERDSAEAE